MDAAIRSTVVPDLWEEQARGLIPAYILFEREYWTGEKVGFCSRCGHSFRGGPKRTEAPDDPDVRFRKAVHNDRMRCPECGADAVMKARGKFRNMKTLRGNVRAVFCQAITPKHVRLRAFYIEWAFPDYNAVRPELDFYEDFFMDLEPGSAAARRKVSRTADNWQTVGIREPWPYRDAWNPYKVMGYTIFLDGLEGTFLGYLPFDLIGSFDWERYTSYGHPVDTVPWCKMLGTCARFPQMEMVAKLGGAQIFTDMVLNGKKYARYIDWSARRITDFLKIPRQYAKEAARFELDIDIIMMIHDLGVDFETARRWRERRWHGKEAREAGADAMRYLEKQHYDADGLAILRDYWNACRDLGRDLDVPGIRWPKHLQLAHDEATASAEAIRKNISSDKYRELYPLYRARYEYEAGDFMAVVPERLGDIALEGQNMHHCVGGYIDRHAAGKLVILFIRRVAAPMIPLWTAELTPDGKLTQIQGYHNDPDLKPKGEDKAWVDGWLREIQKRLRKEKRHG